MKRKTPRTPRPADQITKHEPLTGDGPPTYQFEGREYPTYLAACAVADTTPAITLTGPEQPLPHLARILDAAPEPTQEQEHPTLF